MSTSRREFLANCSAAAAAGLTLATPASLLAADNKKASGEKRIKKAVKIGMVGVKGTLAEKMTVLKELGFDGLELNWPGGP